MIPWHTSRQGISLLIHHQQSVGKIVDFLDCPWPRPRWQQLPSDPQRLVDVFDEHLDARFESRQQPFPVV